MINLNNKYLEYMIKAFIYGVVFITILIVIGSMFYEAPEYRIEIEGGSPQRFIRGEEFTYLIQFPIENTFNNTLQNQTNQSTNRSMVITYVYLGGECFDIYGDLGYMGVSCSSNITNIFPFMSAYPKKGEKATIRIYLEAGNSRELLRNISYIKRGEYIDEERRIKVIEVESNFGEIIRVEKSRGYIVEYIGPDFNATLIK